MARSLPTNFTTELEAGSCKPVMVYEISPKKNGAFGFAPAEKLTDGDFEFWTAANLDYWTEDLQGGVMSANTTETQSGSGVCIALDRSAATGVTTWNQGSINLKPGKWYHASIYAKSDVSAGAGSCFRISNTSASEYLQDDGTWNGTWDAQGFGVNLTSSYQRFSLWFQTNATAQYDDVYNVAWRSTSQTSGIEYWDSASLEGPYDRPGLFYSSQAISWNGDNYTAMALSQSSIREEMNPAFINTVWVEFANAQHELQPYISPTNLLTGSRLTCRLLMRNSAGALYSDSYVLYTGLLERPTRVDHNTFRLVATSLLEGYGSPMPPRTFSPECEFEYGDGINCNYTSNTTADGAGSDTTNLSVWDGTRIFNGATISIGGGENTTVASGGLSSSLVLSSNRTWADGATVALSSCNRRFDNCYVRNRLHEFGGFRGTDEVTMQAHIFSSPLDWSDPDWDLGSTDAAQWIVDQRNIGRYPTVQQSKYWGQSRVSPGLSTSRSTIPLLYGRKLIKGFRISSGVSVYRDTLIRLGESVPREIRLLHYWYVLCEGEIDEMVNWLVDGEAQENRYVVPLGGGDPLYAPDDIQPLLAEGVHYVPGLIGSSNTTTDPITSYDPLELPQVIYYDYPTEVLAGSKGIVVRSDQGEGPGIPNTALSRTAAAFVTIDESAQYNKSDAFPVNRLSGELLFDVKGTKIQEYTAGGSPQAAAFSQNPIWQCLDFILNPRYGLGKIITTDDIEFSEIKTAADVCDVEITFGTAKTWLPEGAAPDNVTAFTGWVNVYDATESFWRTQEVEITDDGANTTRYTIENMITSSRWKLDDSNFSYGHNWTVVGYGPRYVSNAYISGAVPPSEMISKILQTCSGFVTHDDGKIQLKIEKTESSVATFQETGSAAYGIVSESFDWLADQASRQVDVNRVRVDFEDDQLLGAPNTVYANDWDSQNVGRLKQINIDGQAITNRHQAQRIADLELNRAASAETGAAFIVGPAGLLIQPGDIVSVTHSIPGWSAAQKRVSSTEIFGLGDSREFLVRLEVQDYQADWYTDVVDDAPAPVVLPYSGINLTAEQINTDTVQLNWSVNKTTTNETAYVLHPHSWVFNIYRAQNATVELDAYGVPTRGQWIGRTEGRAFAFTDHLAKSSDGTEIGSTLHYLVRSWLAINSNEAEVFVDYFNPAAFDGSSPFNLIFGGDFQESRDWDETEPTSTFVPAKGVTGSPPVGANVTFSTNTTLAYDNDTSTFAYGSIIGTTTFPGDVYNFTSGTDSGRVEVWMQPSGVYSVMKSRYSLDGGSTWTNLQDIFAGKKGGLKAIYSAQLDGVDMSQLQVEVWGQSSVSRVNGTASCYEAGFSSNGTQPFALVSNGMGSIRSDGVTYASLKRPFPGLNPQPGAPVFYAGSENVFRIQARTSTNTSATEGLVIDIIDGEDGTNWTCMTVNATYSYNTKAGYISDSWKVFAGRFIPTEDIAGDLEIRVRTLSTQTIHVDKLACFRGPHIWDWSPHVEEQRGGFHGDAATGKPLGFPPEQWKTGELRTSNVTGDSK